MASNTGLFEVSEEFMRKQSYMMKFSSLCLIGQLLMDEINREKFGKEVEEGVKAGVAYARIR